MSYTFISSEDSQFPSLRNAFNQRWVAHNLAGVYVCFDTQDVVDALNNAVSRGAKPGEVRILGGGHGYENFVYNDQTKYVIDVNGMRDIVHDRATRTTMIGSGQQNWDAAVILQKQYNLQLPAGSCYSVGFGGHITGGGYGLSSRSYGLTVDYISGFEVVIPSQEAGGSNFSSVVANATTNRDLFVALRGGGGGNFGVITKYIFKDLPAAFQMADLFNLAIDWSVITSASKLQKIMDVYAQYCSNIGTGTDPASRQWSKNIFVLGKFSHIASKQIGFLIQSAWNTQEEKTIQRAQINNFIADINKIEGISATPLTSPLAGYPVIYPGMSGPQDGGTVSSVDNGLQTMSWIDATMTNNGSGANQRGVYNSVYFRTGLTETQVNAMFTWLGGAKDDPDLQYNKTLLQIDSYGGAINSYTGNDTSVKQRSSIMKGQFQTYWVADPFDPGHLDAKYVTWQKNFYHAMFAETGGFPDPDYTPPAGVPDPSAAKASVDGCYVNYPNSILGTNGGEPGIEHALHLYFGDEMTRRLVEVKQTYDPDNFFRHAQSIPVSMSGR